MYAISRTISRKDWKIIYSGARATRRGIPYGTPADLYDRLLDAQRACIYGLDHLGYQARRDANDSAHQLIAEKGPESINDRYRELSSEIRFAKEWL